MAKHGTKIRATLESGEVLLEGEDLSSDQIRAAVRERFPDDDAYWDALRALVVTYSDGSTSRPFRFARDTPRVVDGTGYL